MSDDFRLLMIGAMYENGGNTTHRFLDGHPELFVYPFESQIGTRLVTDQLTSMFPVKYRWPVFALDATPEQDYHAIIDEEGKVRARTPHVSKFRHEPFDISDDERRELYVALRRARRGRSRANNVAAFFRATFDAWKDHRAAGDEEVYVGYSPIIVVDAEKILDDLPERPRPARRAQPLVGLRRHEEAAGAAVARATTCSAGRSTSTTRCCCAARYPGPPAHRPRRGRDGRPGRRRSAPVCERSASQRRRLAAHAELERRDRSTRSIPGARSARATPGGEPGDGRRAHATRSATRSRRAPARTSRRSTTRASSTDERSSPR